MLSQRTAISGGSGLRIRRLVAIFIQFFDEFLLNLFGQLYDLFEKDVELFCFVVFRCAFDQGLVLLFFSLKNECICLINSDLVRGDSIHHVLQLLLLLLLSFVLLLIVHVCCEVLFLLIRLMPFFGFHLFHFLGKLLKLYLILLLL